jgi:large subunit ribosomal protein L10
MPRPEKVQAVAEIKERITNARAVFLAEYAGLSVAQQQTLRRELKANGAEFKVVKMTLARLAAAELKIDTLDDHLLGPTGLTIADGDAVAAAKVLKDFAKAHDVFKVKGGLLGLDYLSPERVSELADIEPRELLLAKLAGLFTAPMSSIAGLVGAVQRDVAGLIQALVDKREASGEVAEVAEEAEPPADEASAQTGDAEEATVGQPEAEADEAATEVADEADDGDTEALPDEASAESGDAEEAADAEPDAVVEDVPEASAEAEAQAAGETGSSDPDSEVAVADEATEVTTDEDPAEEAEEE